MTTFYLNSTTNRKVVQEIAYANSLLRFFKKTFFNKIVKNSKKVDKLLDSYINCFTENKCILIPKDLTSKKLSFSEKVFLKNPKNLFEYPNQFEDFVDFIFIKEANLINLDEALSKYFNSGYKGLDRIYVLNSEARLAQYEDVILGIGSNKIFYYKDSQDCVKFQKLLLKEINKISTGREDMRAYNIYYKLGTTAISVKGLKNEIN